MHKACAKAKSKGKGKGKGKGTKNTDTKQPGKATKGIEKQGGKAVPKNTKLKNECSRAYHRARKEAFAKGLDLEEASALGRKASSEVKALLSA